VKRPSDDVTLCRQCHDQIGATYATSLHYTAAGLRHGVSGRFAPGHAQKFEKDVFPGACQTCHASCGDCHVKSPTIGGVSTGLLNGHSFVRRQEGKTCAACHGGRVYPEFTGEYGGAADVHYEKGMVCADCHGAADVHGDGVAYTSRRDVKTRPSCARCHPAGAEKTAQATSAHQQHRATVSCVACHASGPYRNCTECHLGKGATSAPGFTLGRNPRNPQQLTTLRLIPTVRGTFAPAGLVQERHDTVPNYWDTTPHNVRKRTDRTRSCDACHVERRGFLTKDALPPNGSKANEALIIVPRAIKE